MAGCLGDPVNTNTPKIDTRRVQEETTDAGLINYSMGDSTWDRIDEDGERRSWEWS